MESSISIPCLCSFHATVPETERNATNVDGEGATPSGGTRIEGLSHGLRCVYPRGAARVRTERCPRPLFPYADVQDELGFQVRAAGCNSLSACQSLQRLLGRRVAHTHVDDGSIPSAATTHAGFLSARRESRGTGFSVVTTLPARADDERLSVKLVRIHQPLHGVALGEDSARQQS